MITIIIPYYNQPLMLEKQFETLQGCPFKVIFIDDYSPTPIVPKGNYSYYRITDDKGINWQGAKNLGTELAQTEWILHMDIDHTLTKYSLNWLYENVSELDKTKAYRFHRRLKDKYINPHSNSFLITKENYIKNGGYDLRFQGTKAGEYLFTSKLKFEMIPAVLETYGGDEIKDAMSCPNDSKRESERYKIYKSLPEQPFINFKYECLQ